VIRLLVLSTGCLYPRKYCWYSFFVRDCVDPKAIVWRVGLC